MLATAGRLLICSCRSHVPQDHAGLTYIALLIAIALIGATMAVVGVWWSNEVRRGKEADLLFAGQQFRRAIGSYYDASPGAKRFPQTLDELLEDRRFPQVRRHLRRIFFDPLTAQRDWVLVRGPDGGIVGVHSVSNGVPLKRANFPAMLQQFANAERYSDWRFVYVPQQVMRPSDSNMGSTLVEPNLMPSQ